MHHTMESIQDVQRLSHLLGDDLQIRFPHIAADKTQSAHHLWSQRLRAAA
jgi:hypothetical protein